MAAKNIFFIDSRVADYQNLIAQFGAGTEWHLLNAEQDGIEQMQRLLEGRTGLDSIQIVSHGSVGTLYLGSTVLNSGNLGSYQSQLQTIGASLSATGDLLLYGCDVAQGEAGLQFIDSLAQMTGADVAASTDPSGSQVLGGDSALESTTGAIEVSTLSLNSLPVVLAVNSAPSFAVGDGIVTTAIGTSGGSGKSVTVQADGKILVAGTSRFHFALVRYNTDGSLDTSFSGDGKVTTNLGKGSDFGQSVTVQADGKILVAGSSNGDFALARYNTDGSLDTRFSDDGMLTTAIGTGDDGGRSVTLQADGKILVAGTRTIGYSMDSYSDFALVRYNPDGSLDTRFSGDGMLTTAIGNQVYDYGESVTVQADGKILVAGSSNGDFALARYNTDGSLDTGFSGDGWLTTDFGWGSSGHGYSVAVQTDGKILVAGSSYNGSNIDFALVRYNTDGSLDTSFSGDGMLTTAIGNYNHGQSVTLQADGKILVAGTSNNGSNADFALVRYNTDGSLDTSFSDDGKVTTASGTGESVTVQADGKILVAGRSANGSNSDFALVRYNTDGSLDSSFDSVNTNSLGGVSRYTENGAAVILDGNVHIHDVELSALNSYGGATLTLARHGGASSQDVYSGAGITAGQASGNFTVSSTVIGTYDYAAGTLTLTFNSSATESLVNQALQSLAYRNSSDAPPARVQIDWTFSDGNTGVQGTGGAQSVSGSTTVNITPVNDAPTGSVTLSGTATQGQTLTASNTLADADGLGTIGYQWLRGDTTISGATANSYTLTASDVGQAISVRASYTDGQGTLESKTSTSVTPIAALQPGVVFGDATGLVTTEAGGIDSFTVALRAAPRHDVTLTFTINDATEAVFAASGKATHSVTFTAANWATAKTVVLRGVDDKPEDGDVGYTIRTSIQSADLRYDGMRSGTGLSIANLTAWNTDDDAPDAIYGDSDGTHIADDLIQGGNGASDLYGLFGRDELYGNNGDDRLYGGYGDDVLYGNADDDELEGEQGNDKLDGGSGQDTLNGGTGNDTLYGQAGDDNLLGEAGKDSLLGGDGNDTLNGGVDADAMDGGNGADTYYIDNAADVVRDSGTDTAVDTVYIMSYLSGGITLGAGIDNGALNDLAGKGKLTGNTGNNTLTGNAEENVILGGDGTDTLSGGAGNDTLDGGVGADSLAGGTGTDSLAGGAGNDSLGGGAGDDVLYSGDGDDVVDGGDGADLIIGGGGAGNDKYNGGAGIDTVKYTSAIAGITVDLVKSTATSTAGKDAAKIGTDTLSGIENVIAGNFNDIVKGSKVANVLTGGLGSDSLYGGADKVKDIFDFNAIAESKTGTARDKIYDFVSKIDKLDLAGIDANTTKASDQTFAFSGTTAKANSVWYKVADVDGNATTKDIVVYGDVNGDAKADFEIGLVGVTAVVAADFVL